MSLYGTDPVWLPTVEEAAAADEDAQLKTGVPQRVLMENAARAAAQVLIRLYPHGSVLALAGPGNNGGDAFVVARTLRAWGREARVAFFGSGRPEGALAHDHEVPEVAGDDALAAALRDAAVVVDGLLGTGSQGAPRGDVARAIELANGSVRPILALDLPSGADATTGAVAGAAIRAEATVSFGWPKLGLLFHPARAHCGRLLAVEIGFPPVTECSGRALTPAWARARLPVREARAHKGTEGTVFLLAGSAEYGGAMLLAATGALRAGAGVVRVASDARNRELLLAAVPEAIFADRDDDVAAARASALVAGPGIGTDAGARRALDAALAATGGLPTLLDADALNLLAGDDARLRALAAERPLVLTPHPGELSRLTGSDTARIAAAPIDAARAFAERIGCVVLLKGAPSIVAAPGEPILVNTTGSSDLAKAGMGDTLSGAIGAFLARGASPGDAAGLGLFYTGRAADLARRGRALTPTDVATFLADAFDKPGEPAYPLDLPFILLDQAAAH